MTESEIESKFRWPLTSFTCNLGCINILDKDGDGDINYRLVLSVFGGLEIVVFSLIRVIGGEFDRDSQSHQT